MTSSPERPDPAALMRSRPYVGLLLISALLGAPIAAVAYYFLKLTDLLQHWTYSDLPTAVGFRAGRCDGDRSPLAGPARGGNRCADLHRTRLGDRVRDVLTRNSQPALGRNTNH